MIKHLFAFIQNQFHVCVKAVTNDNAKELCEGNMLDLYHKLGIKHQKSCTHTPNKMALLNGSTNIY